MFTTPKTKFDLLIAHVLVSEALELHKLWQQHKDDRFLQAAQLGFDMIFNCPEAAQA